MTRRGLTLIEVLVVVLIIALLIGILVPTYRGAMARGHVTETVSNLRQLGQAMAMYQSDYGERPTSFEVLQASPYRLLPEMYVAKADPIGGEFGTIQRRCQPARPVAAVKTSYEHILDWPEYMNRRFVGRDENHGIVAVRVFAPKSEYFDVSRIACDGPMMYEGSPLLRLRKDGSVEVATLITRPSTVPGTTKAWFVYDLYTDGMPFPPPPDP